MFGDGVCTAAKVENDKEKVMNIIFLRHFFLRGDELNESDK